MRPKLSDTTWITRILRAAVVCGAVWAAAPLLAQTGPGFAYIGTLDKKLLVYDENKEEVVDQIPLQGIPGQTVLSRDQSKLVIMTTQMAIETVDLKSRKMLSHFSIADEKSRPRGRGMALDPTGRYLYASLRAAVRKRVEPLAERKLPDSG